MIVETFLLTIVGAASPLSVITPQNLFRVYPHQTAVLRVSLQFQQPEWKYFHAKWKFLTKNLPVLYCDVECNRGSSSANRTCKYIVEKEGLFETRVDIEEDGSLVLRDVQPEDAGKYEIEVFALDESGRATLQLDVLAGLPLSEMVSLPSSTISAAVHRTARLPIHPLDPAWTFLSVKWEFVTTNVSIPILVYFIGNCRGTALEWWERDCYIHKTVAAMYQQRVTILRNGTLEFYSVGLKDAGIYQATIRTASITVQEVVNLTVTQETSKSFHHENVAQIILAGLLFCFLVLLVGKHVWTITCPRASIAPRKGDGALL